MSRIVAKRPVLRHFLHTIEEATSRAATAPFSSAAMKPSTFPPLLSVLAMGSALLLAGCASPGSPVVSTASSSTATELPVPPGSDDFPRRETAVLPQGTFPRLEALRAMRTGMGKDQVQNLLGSPHFSEGPFGVREWNYIFHFRTGAGPAYVTCQYMARFNQDAQTSGLYWNDADCAMLVVPPDVKAVAVVAAPAPAHRVILDTDRLFAPGGGSPADLLRPGRAKIEDLAIEIKRNFARLRHVVVRDHTDRLGAGTHKASLSQERADTVRGILIEQGVDGRLVRATGMQDSEPLVQCAKVTGTRARTACLRPNRRMEIEVAEGP